MSLREKRGKRACKYTVKLVSRAKKVPFCEAKWDGNGRHLTARVMVNNFDLAKVLVDKRIRKSLGKRLEEELAYRLTDILIY